MKACLKISKTKEKGIWVERKEKPKSPKVIDVGIHQGEEDKEVLMGHGGSTASTESVFISFFL